jgi:hypothetical protein
MIRIAISVAARLPLGSVGFEREPDDNGERLIWLEPHAREFGDEPKEETMVSELIDDFIDDLISDGYEIEDIVSALESKLAALKKKEG